MKKEIGLWIDHRQAVIVILSDQGEEVKEIKSDLEEYVQDSASQDDSGEDKRHTEDRRTDNQLNRYYDAVIEKKPL